MAILTEQTELILYFLVGIYIIPQIIVGFFLLYKFKKTRMINLIPLVVFFFLNALEVFLIALNAPFIVYHLIVFLSNISLIIFTKFTFYQDKKSAFKYILGLAVLIKIIDFILRSIVPFPIAVANGLSKSEIPLYYLNLILTSSMILVSYSWFAYSALTYYKTIKDEPIAPWIKKRYLILGTSAFFISLNSIFYLFLPYTPDLLNNPQYIVVAILISSMNVIFSLGNLMGWMMPNKLKIFFNRNFEPATYEDLPEKDLMEKLKSQLSEKIQNGNN